MGLVSHPRRFFFYNSYCSGCTVGSRSDNDNSNFGKSLWNGELFEFKLKFIFGEHQLV